MATNTILEELKAFQNRNKSAEDTNKTPVVFPRTVSSSKASILTDLQRFETGADKLEEQNATWGQTALAIPGAALGLIANGYDFITRVPQYVGMKLAGYERPIAPWEGALATHFISLSPEEQEQRRQTYKEQMAFYRQSTPQWVQDLDEGRYFTTDAGIAESAYLKIPGLEEAVEAASADTRISGQNPIEAIQSIFNIIGVHGTRALMLGIPVVNLAGVAGFGQMGVDEIDQTIKQKIREGVTPLYEQYLQTNNLTDDDDTYQQFLKENDLIIPDSELQKYLGISGAIYGAIEYSEALLHLGAMKAPIFKRLINQHINRVIFRGIGSRIALFAASQGMRAGMEALEEGSQTGIAILTANAIIQNLNEGREGQFQIPEVGREGWSDVLEAAVEGGKAGFFLGVGPGGITAIRKERILQKKKALRQEATEKRNRIFQEHEKVTGTMERLRPLVVAQVHAEKRAALQGAEEGDLWARARALQNESLLTGEQKRIEDEEGATISDKLINFIINNSDGDDFFIDRYTAILNDMVQEDSTLGAADKFFIQVGLLNDKVQEEDLLALRRILDHAATNLVDENGNPMFGDINEAAKSLIRELNTGENIVKFLQDRMTKYDKDSLEHSFLNLFMSRKIYKDMPVASKYGFFRITENNPQNVQQAYQRAIYKATQQFYGKITERLQMNKHTVDQEDIVDILNILQNMKGTDEDTIAEQEEDGKVLNSIRKLNGSITFGKALSPDEQAFLTNYQDLINNLIYAVSSLENAETETKRTAITKAYNYLAHALGQNFVNMLEDTADFMPVIVPGVKRLNEIIADGIQKDIDNTTDPIKKQVLRNSLAYYRTRQRREQGTGFSFAQGSEESEEGYVEFQGADIRSQIESEASKMYSSNLGHVLGKEMYQNAVDAVKDKEFFSGEVNSIYVYRDQLPGMKDVFVVADEGLGMSPQIIVSKFLPAYVSGKTGATGGGLGMAKLAILGSTEEFIVHSIYETPQNVIQISRLEGSAEAWKDFASMGGYIKRIQLKPDTTIEIHPGITLVYTEVEKTPLIKTGTAIAIKVPSRNDTPEGAQFIEEASQYFTDIAVGEVVKNPSEAFSNAIDQGDFPNFGFWKTYEGAPLKVNHVLESLGFARDKYSDDFMGYRYNKEAKDYGLIHTIDIPTAEIEIIAPHGENNTLTMSYWNIPVLNRGIEQFKLSQHFNEEITLPYGITINIKSKVHAKHKDYAFTPDREHVRSHVEKAISNYLNQLGLSVSKKMNEKYQDVTDSAPKLPSKRKYIDISQQIPKELVDEFVNSPVVHWVDSQLERYFNYILSELPKQFPGLKTYGRARYAGLISNSKAYGVHFGIPHTEDPTEIFMDPMLTMRDAIDAMSTVFEYEEIEHFDLSPSKIPPDIQNFFNILKGTENEYVKDFLVALIHDSPKLASTIYRRIEERIESLRDSSLLTGTKAAEFEALSRMREDLLDPSIANTFDNVLFDVYGKGPTVKGLDTILEQVGAATNTGEHPERNTHAQMMFNFLFDSMMGRDLTKEYLLENVKFYIGLGEALYKRDDTPTTYWGEIHGWLPMLKTFKEMLKDREFKDQVYDVLSWFPERLDNLNYAPGMSYSEARPYISYYLLYNAELLEGSVDSLTVDLRGKLEELNNEIDSLEQQNRNADNIRNAHKGIELFLEDIENDKDKYIKAFNVEIAYLKGNLTEADIEVVVGEGNIWDNVEEETEDKPTNAQRIVRRFNELLVGIGMHEAFHQRIDSEGIQLAREFTFNTGVLLEAAYKGKPTVPDAETASEIVNTLKRLYDKTKHYRDQKLEAEFITTKGGHDSYAFSDTKVASYQEDLQLPRGEGIPQISTGYDQAGIRLEQSIPGGFEGLISQYVQNRNGSDQDVSRHIKEAVTKYMVGDVEGLKKQFPDANKDLSFIIDSAIANQDVDKEKLKKLVTEYLIWSNKENTIPEIHRKIESLWAQGNIEGLTKVIQSTRPMGWALKQAISKAKKNYVDFQISLPGLSVDQLGDQLRSGSKIIKGQTTFMQDGTAYLEFFKTADVSTIAHEFMHIFSRHMSKAQVGIAQTAFINSRFADLDAESKQDFLNKLERYWKLFMQDPTNPRFQKGEADYLIRGYMEYVSRQFEKYLLQGLAPTKALTKAFKVTKGAMKNVYESISDVPDIRKELDQAVKAVFDNLIAGNRYVKTPIAKVVYVEGNPYTVFVSRSSNDTVKTLLRKLREGYSDVQGIHDQIRRYAKELLGEKEIRKDKDLELRIYKVSTYAEAKAAIDYIDRKLLDLQRQSRNAIIEDIKAIVKGVEWKKIDATLAAKIKAEIEGIDLKKLTPKKLNSLIGMRNWLSNNIKKGIITQDMTNIPLERLQELDRLAQKNIYDFDINELQTLRDALTTIIQQGEKKQFLRIKKRIYYLNTEHEKLLGAVKKLKPKDKYSGLDPNPNNPTLEDVRKGLWGSLAHTLKVGGRQPHRLLFYIANFDKTNPLYNFVNMIREGTRIVNDRNTNDMKWMRGLINAVGGAKNWSKKLIPEDEQIDRSYLSYHKVVDSLGREVELPLTKAERITIFLYSMNEDARRHMLEGGIIMPQLKGTGIRYTLTPQTLAEIISGMDMDEKYVAYQMLDYYENNVKQAINDVSTNLIGYGIAKEFNYFPIYAEGKDRGNTEVLNKPALSKSMRQFQRKLIDRQGFLKERTGSPSPLYIHDAFWAMKKNLMDVNRYVGLAEPLNYVKALFRDQQDPKGVYYSIARSWGPEAVETIDEWLNRIEDPTVTEGEADKFLRFIKRTSITAQLGANMFVSMFQRVSLVMAHNYDISWASIGKAMAKNSSPSTGFGVTANHNMAEMARIHPQLAPRFETGPNIDVHELYLDSLTRHSWTKPTTAMQDIKNIHDWRSFKTALTTLSVTSSMKFIKDNDAWALSTIWDSVQIEGAKRGWSEDQMKDKFMEIYYNTQPQYDTENISLMMSTKNPLSRIAFATYQTMPNQIWNETEYHIREWANERKKPKSARDRNISTLKMVEKVFTGLVLQNLLVNMIRELRNIGDEPPDDEGIPYFGGAFLGTLKSMIATVPYIGGITAGVIDAFADPRNRYNAFDTPGSFVGQLYTGAVVEGVDAWEAMNDGELELAAYHSLRVLTKLLGISRGYSWDTILGQTESAVKMITEE